MDNLLVLKEEYKNIFTKFREEKFGETLKNRGFVFQYDTNEKEADLLFIGINPSYTEKYEQGQYFEDSYNRENTKDRQYFKPFWDISNEFTKDTRVVYNGIWTHIDLLVFRETNQKYIDELIKDSQGCNFILEQLEIAKKRLSEIAPKVVIVCNSKAREFLGKDKSINQKTGKENGVWMGLQFKFDEEFGSHRVLNLPKLVNTHFLFTSMLSGQRALDNGSKERLIWQTKKIFEK